MEEILNFDFTVLNWIQQNLRCAFLDFLMPAVTFLGNGGWFWIALAAAFLCFKSTRKTGLAMGIALILGLFVCNLGLKPLVARVRPYTVDGSALLGELELLVKKPHDFSFPSGHTIASFEGAGVLMITQRKRFGRYALVLAFIIAFSRLYLYVHYPTDVIAGIVLGTLFAAAGVILSDVIYRAFEKRRNKNKAL